MGTNGEAYALSFKEKEEILLPSSTRSRAASPVYAGTGCITTAETIRLSKRAEELGADALSVITSSFALASQKELYDHYTAVAKAVNLPSSVQHPRPHRQQAAARDRARLCAVMWRTS